jgi:hypothetical protein
MKTYFVPGEWNAICDQCGRKYKASQLRKRWDGLMVCQDDWETRHPQDFVRGVKEDTSVPWTRPEPADVETVIAVNCNAHYPRYMEPLVEVSIEVYKAYTTSPVVVSDGAILTVHCTLEVN